MKLKSFLLSALFIFGGTTSDAAAATVTYLGDQTALITIDVQFDAFTEFTVPAFADHIIHNTDRNEVGFAITDDTGARPEIDRITTVVLSQQPLVDTRYQIAPDTTGEFTLVALVHLSEPTTSLDATITHLPYWIDGRRTSAHLE